MSEAPALVEEAAKKSGLVWVDVPGGEGRARAVWHVWHDGVAYVLVGGSEQPLPGIDTADTVVVTVRSKDKGYRLVAWEAAVEPVPAGGEDWTAIVPLLLGKRLNLPDGEAAADRWATECRLYRLRPTGRLVEGPGSYLPDSHAAPPPPSPARTRVPLPFTLARIRQWMRG